MGARQVRIAALGEELAACSHDRPSTASWMGLWGRHCCPALVWCAARAGWTVGTGSTSGLGSAQRRRTSAAVSAKPASRRRARQPARACCRDYFYFLFLYFRLVTGRNRWSGTRTPHDDATNERDEGGTTRRETTKEEEEATHTCRPLAPPTSLAFPRSIPAAPRPSCA